MQNSPTVLIVDDEAAFAQVLAQHLTSAGFQVFWCGKIQDAREKLSKEKFDCILLDMSLQTGSGEEVLKYVRLNKFVANYETPIFVMSGFLNPPLIARIKPQVTEIFVKPFDHKVLISKISSLFPEGPQIPLNSPEPFTAEPDGEPAPVFDVGTEKAFLHTLANFLAIADANLDLAFARLGILKDKQPQTFLQVYEGLKAVRNAASLLDSRRQKVTSK